MFSNRDNYTVNISILFAVRLLFYINKVKKVHAKHLLNMNDKLNDVDKDTLSDLFILPCDASSEVVD